MGAALEPIHIVKPAEPPRPRRQGIAVPWRRLGPWLVLLALVIAWELIVRAMQIPAFLLPTPSAVISRGLIAAPLIWSDSLVTIVEIALGFLLSLAIGIPAAIAIAHSPTLEQSVYPLLVSAQVLPKIAIAPILVVWFGFGLLPKVIIAFLVAFFPVVIDTVVGLKAVPAEMIYLSRSMGGTPLKTLLRIELPFAAPNIFAGLKVAATLAVVGAIVGEFVASDKGLGNMLQIANGQMDTPLLFAGVFALSVIGVVFFYALEWMESLMISWHVRMREHFQ